jgi:hypothetical protein
MKSAEELPQSTQHIKRALGLYQKGDDIGALKALGQALDLNPALAASENVQKLAARLTGLKPEEAAQRLADAEWREAFIVKRGRRGMKSSGRFPGWFLGVAALLVGGVFVGGLFILRSLYFDQAADVLANYEGTGATEHRTVDRSPELTYEVVIPFGQPPDDGWPTLVAIHGRGQTGVDMAAQLGEATRTNRILLIAPTLLNLKMASYADLRGTVQVVLEDARMVGMLRPASALHYRGQVFLGQREGVGLVNWLMTNGLDYSDAGFTMERPLAIMRVESDLTPERIQKTLDLVRKAYKP